MQKMKRNKTLALAALICILLCAMIFTACTPGDSSQKPVVGKVLVTVECKTIYENADALKKAEQLEIYQELVRNEGMLIESFTVEFREEDTVFDVLFLALEKRGLALRYTGGKNTRYVQSIAGIQEKKFGGMSGWKFRMNDDDFGSKGCSQVKVADGDIVWWHFTLDGSN